MAQIEGRVLEKGTRKPLAEVNVYLLPDKLKATTDAEGRFVFESEPAGEFTWVVSLSGYERLEKAGRLPVSEPQTLYLERLQYPLYESTTYGKEDKRDLTRKSIRAADAIQIPGSGNDPVKALQNLPGINRPSPFLSQVIIQGSAPRDTRYLIDDHEVPILFHFGGLTSVVPPEALDRVDYLSAGYGADHGRALGGLVGVWTRPPRTDRLHGIGSIDLFSSTLLVEGKAGEGGSFLAGARKSYIGEVLRAVLPRNKDFNLTAAPSYGDLTLLYEKSLTPIDRFRVLSVGSVDTLEFLLKEPVGMDPSFRGNFSTKTAFYRLIPQLIHKHGPDTESRWSVGLGRDWIRFDTESQFFILGSTSLTARGEVSHRFSPRWSSQWGFDNRYTWAHVDLSLRDAYFAGGVGNPFSAGELQQVGVDRKFANIGLFWRNEIRPAGDTGPLTLIPALRGDYFNSTRQAILQPRLSVQERVDDSLELRLASGTYSQPPLEQEIDATLGNPDLKAARAYHVAFSAEKDFRAGSARGFVLTPGVFYKYFDRLAVQSAARVERNGQLVPENYNNSGRGRAYGFESLLRMELAPWTGWLSYTLSRSTRSNHLQSEFLFPFDQTHLLTAIAARELGAHWRISARLRYATGNPTTPVTGSIFDADNDVFFPTRGAFFSQRLNPFAQLDLRVDKSWIHDTWILSAYLDIQNVTNRRNLEQVQYAYDYSTRSQVSGLPIIPSLGVRAEF